MRQYILNENGEPMLAPDLSTWAKWFETSDRTVGKTKIGESNISTVFLGLDHNYSGSGAPILWETMVFGGKLDQEQTRCSGTRQMAENMHREMVERIKQEESELFQ